MDEISMFKILRPAPPATVGEISRAVGNRLDVALAPGPPSAQARWRPGRLALVGGLSLAVAAAAVTFAVAWPGRSVPTAPDTGPLPGTAVRELAYRTAAVAAAQPDVRPGQWVYWKEKPFGGKPDGVFQVWTTADSRRAAYVDDKGKVQYIDFCKYNRAVGYSGPCAGFTGQPTVSVAPHNTTVSGEAGPVKVSYRGLRSLPDAPQALVAHLGGLRFPHWAGWGPAPVREFSIIEQLLITYVMPPALTAEFYRALALIPGVTIDHHAVDVAGRPGLGLSMTIPPAFGGGIDEIIINPRTYQLAGEQLLTGPRAGSLSRVIGGTAILQHSFVSRPGQLP